MKQLNYLICILMACLVFTGCGSKGQSSSDPSEELTAFRTDVDSFCEKIRELDSAINNVDTSADDFEDALLSRLDELQSAFQDFSEMDFPSDYDYLETLADEAAEYMTTAVAAFRDVFTRDDYTEAMLDAQYEYASENYSRAYKRITVILTFLNGKTDADTTLTVQ